MDEPITMIRREVLAKGWGTLHEDQFRFTRRNGDTEVLKREVYDHGHGAAILLCNREAGTVLLTRQFRYPAHFNGDPAWLIEACAGLLDGDDPQTCALREAEEETGHRPTNPRFVAVTYLSPGSVSEKVWLFLGDYSADTQVGAGGGVAGEGEDIEVLELPFAEALRMAETGEIADAKTLILLQWAALNGVFALSAGKKVRPAAGTPQHRPRAG